MFFFVIGAIQIRDDDDDDDDDRVRHKLEIKSITSKEMQYRHDIVTCICSLREWS